MQGALPAPLHPPGYFLCLGKESNKETDLGNLRFPKDSPLGFLSRGFARANAALRSGYRTRRADTQRTVSVLPSGDGLEKPSLFSVQNLPSRAVAARKGGILGNRRFPKLISFVLSCSTTRKDR